MFSSTLVSFVTLAVTAVLGVTADTNEPRALGFKALRDKYCNNPNFHCLYVNKNVGAPTFNAGSQVYHAYGHKVDINLYVVENGQNGYIEGNCGDAESSKARYQLSNKKGSYIQVHQGSLNAYFKSNVNEKITGGSILKSSVHGDDLVVYCPEKP
ncbi:unnamed protein product [Sympodiomycopsis kandeliae]